MINSRQKGNAGEREFATLIYDHLGVTLERNLQQPRSGGHDLIVTSDCLISKALDRFAVEGTTPIQAGDSGWLWFSDKGLSEWQFDQASDSPQGYSRVKNLNDCVFYPGVWKRVKPLNEYSDEWTETRDLASTTRMALKEGDIHLQALLWHLVLRETGFDVYGAQTVSLMDTLIQALEAGASGFAASAAAYAASGAALTLIKGESEPPDREPQIVSRP